MAKTTLFVDSKNMVNLKDSENVVYTTLNDIFNRLKVLRAGTIVEVQNEKYSDVTVDTNKMYYLLFTPYYGIRLIYRNLATHAVSVIAVMDHKHGKTDFLKKLSQLVGNLMILNATTDRQAYTVIQVPMQQVTVEPTSAVKLLSDVMSYTYENHIYKNKDGENIQQRWMTLLQGVMLCLTLSKKNVDTNMYYALVTENGTVLFIC